MKHAIAFAILVIATPAGAQDKPLCVDASRSNAYNVQPIALHEVLARNVVGDRRGVRLGTTCIHIDRAAMVGLHSLTQCISKGDEVSVAVPGGRGETCRISSVSQVPEDYAAAKYRD